MKLKPFSTTPLTEKIDLYATVEKLTESHWRLRFVFTGDTESILWPEVESPSQRRSELWLHTCLEAFLGEGPDDTSPYLEINGATSGHWNAYSFSKYREGMSPAPIEVSVIRDGASAWTLEVISRKPFPQARLGLTAVVEFRDGSLSYWSLHHPGPKPDFHRKAGWTAPSTH